MCLDTKKHNPFDWVHSEFGFLISVVLFFAAFVFTTFVKTAPLSTFLEGLLALNALFFLKQYGKGNQELAKFKSQSIEISRGDPLT